MTKPSNPFGAYSTLAGGFGTVGYYRLAALPAIDLGRLPFTIKVLLENVLRRAGGEHVSDQDVLNLARWRAQGQTADEFTFLPARVLLQDFTGVPAVVDLAAMRSAVARLGGDPKLVNPLVPADLVIDHSVQVDAFGSVKAFNINVDHEFARNSERYALLRWAQQAFHNFRVVPPGMGICHQVNLEYLAGVVLTRQEGVRTLALPDTVVGTDSHTTMVNGLGVLGWGVGGIEAEAALLGQPIYLLTPAVVGMRLTGQLPHGTTATDLVLHVVQLLRKHGVVGKFVEFTGSGLSALSLPDRATIANMSPEYGATAALFPVDDETLRYLRSTNRDEQHVHLVESYCKEQGLFRTDDAPEPDFTEQLALDLGTIEASVAGPRRPQDRVPLHGVGANFRAAFPQQFLVPDLANGHEGKERFDWEGGALSEVQEPSKPVVCAIPSAKTVMVNIDGLFSEIAHGSVAIAAITSCTNTSNPSVMIGAGLLAKKAVEHGLMVKPHVKTSLAPGSRAVTGYLKAAGLVPYLEALHFHLVGYGCTTCIGNSGPLPEAVAEAVQCNDLVVAAVLSGNRNFEGRIHPQVRASYLAAPALVVAFAIAGRVDLDLTSEPLGMDPSGHPVYLSEIWPTPEEIQGTIDATLVPELFPQNYALVAEGGPRWRALPAPAGDQYDWDSSSSYVQEPPFFVDLASEPAPLSDITAARVLAVLGDSVTTDHISPAGAIPKDSPAGQYLIGKGVQPADFNSFGARRGNHDVMVRGTFGNIRLRNSLVPEYEGDWTIHLPDGTAMRIFDAAMRYQNDGVPLLIIAGSEYGSGSSRDWAAKGPMLLGVRAVIAESYERIHRSNLIGMGVLPLEFLPGQNLSSLGLSGREAYDVLGIKAGLRPRQTITVQARRDGGTMATFQTIVRIDSAVEVEYYRNGGVLQTVLRRMVRD